SSDGSSRTKPGTDFILDALVAEGLGHLFMVPGGLVDPFLPALARQPKIQPVVAAHEGGAVYMADGYARASGRFGAARGIGGPGCCNMATGGRRRQDRRLAGAGHDRGSISKIAARFKMRVRRRSTTRR